MIKLSDLINEIGEASARPYLLKRAGSDGDAKLRDRVYTEFIFTLDDIEENPLGIIQLSWQLSTSGEGVLEVSFDIMDGGNIAFDTTNYGTKTLFRVMSTVVDAIKSFREQELKDVPLTVIRFSTSPEKSSGKISKGGEIRANLYTKYISKYFDIIEKDINPSGDSVFKVKDRDNVNEIGEGSATPYKFSFDFEEASNFNRPTEYTYSFELDDQPEYKGKIVLHHFEEGMGTWGSDKLEGLSIEFNVIEKEDDNVNKGSFKTTNLGVKTMFRIMSTVIAVIKDVSRRVEGSITHFRFSAADSKASTIDASGEAQRLNIYDRFIKNAFSVKEKEIDNGISIYRLKEPLSEGVIKNLSIAALLGLAAAAGVSSDAQAQIRNKAQDSGEKIVNVVNNKGQVEFRDIAEFKKHFENNVEDYQAIGIKPNSEFFIVINDVPMVGYIGVSKDMQTSLKKAGTEAMKAGKKSGFLLRDVQQDGDNFVGVVLYRI